MAAALSVVQNNITDNDPVYLPHPHTRPIHGFGHRTLPLYPRPRPRPDAALSPRRTAKQTLASNPHPNAIDYIQTPSIRHMFHPIPIQLLHIASKLRRTFISLIQSNVYQLNRVRVQRPISPYSFRPTVKKNKVSRKKDLR